MIQQITHSTGKSVKQCSHETGVSPSSMQQIKCKVEGVNSKLLNVMNEYDDDFSTSGLQEWCARMRHLQLRGKIVRSHKAIIELNGTLNHHNFMY